MRVGDFDYQLPPELIAQEPAARRDSSRMLCLDRSSPGLSETPFDRLDLIPKLIWIASLSVQFALPTEFRAKLVGVCAC